MTEFQTGYEALATDSYYENEDEDDQDPTENIIHVVPDRNKGDYFDNNFPVTLQQLLESDVLSL